MNKIKSIINFLAGMISVMSMSAVCIGLASTHLFLDITESLVKGTIKRSKSIYETCSGLQGESKKEKLSYGLGVFLKGCSGLASEIKYGSYDLFDNAKSWF